MAHGAPDWGVFASKATVYNLQDMAELAARLGSIVTLDRRGDVVLIDDFDDAPLRWDTAVFVAGSTAGRVTTHAKRGGGSVQLVTAANGNAYANINRMFELLRAYSLGIEFSLTLDANSKDVLISADLYDGTTHYICRLKIDVANDRAQVYNDSGAYETVITTLSAGHNDFLWYAPKLVFDWDTGYYKRLLWSGQQVDLSAIAVYSVAAAASPYMKISIQADGTAGGVATSYVDDFILTQNEP